MKTQINTLIHGNPSTPGTNSHDRAAIAAKVIEGNPIDLTRSINAIDQRIAEIKQGTAPKLNN